MSIPFPEPDPNLDPSATIFQTNYGATGMMNALAQSNKRSKQTSNNIYSLLQQLSNVNSRASSMASGPSMGPRSYTPRRHGNMNGAGRHIGGKRQLKLDALEHAIGGQESSWNYGARNSSSGAAGYAQILPGNFVGKGGWDVEALGHNIGLHKFMTHPRLQRKIARHKMNEYIHQFGLRGATQAWYGGPGAVGNDNISGGSGYPTTGQYADQVMRGIRRYIRRHRR